LTSAPAAPEPGQPAEPETGEPEPTYGVPGKPFDRRSPFYIGFVGATGALVAYSLYHAFLGIGSVLVQVVVAFFLAAGLNPSVEALERRGLRRSRALVVVIIAALVVLALFLVAIVPVITDQVHRLTENVPLWLDELQRNSVVQRINDEYDVIG
jgi:predicted PurR-regulated permease PerM